MCVQEPCVYLLSAASVVIRNTKLIITRFISVSDPDKGVCADPVDRGAILGRGELDPHSESRERQLAPDKGRGKT